MEDQKVTAGEYLKFRIPSIGDPDGDNAVAEAFIRRVNPLPSYIKFDGSTFTFKPKANNVGVHLLTLTLTDDHTNSLSSSYHFRLFVVEETKPKTDRAENEDNNEDERDKSPQTNPNEAPAELTARIESVSQDGLLTIHFN